MHRSFRRLSHELEQVYSQDESFWEHSPHLNECFLSAFVQVFSSPICEIVLADMDKWHYENWHTEPWFWSKPHQAILIPLILPSSLGMFPFTTKNKGSRVSLRLEHDQMLNFRWNAFDHRKLIFLFVGFQRFQEFCHLMLLKPCNIHWFWCQRSVVFFLSNLTMCTEFLKYKLVCPASTSDEFISMLPFPACKLRS